VSSVTQTENIRDIPQLFTGTSGIMLVIGHDSLLPVPNLGDNLPISFDAV